LGHRDRVQGRHRCRGSPERRIIPVSKSSEPCRWDLATIHAGLRAALISGSRANCGTSRSCAGNPGIVVVILRVSHRPRVRCCSVAAAMASRGGHSQPCRGSPRTGQTRIDILDKSDGCLGQRCHGAKHIVDASFRVARVQCWRAQHWNIIIRLISPTFILLTVSSPCERVPALLIMDRPRFLGGISLCRPERLMRAHRSMGPPTFSSTEKHKRPGGRVAWSGGSSHTWGVRRGFSHKGARVGGCRLAFMRPALYTVQEGDLPGPRGASDLGTAKSRLRVNLGKISPRRSVGAT